MNASANVETESVDVNLFTAISLEVKQLSDVSRNLVTALEDRLKYHRCTLQKAQRWSECSCKILAFLVPIYSAILIWVASIPGAPIGPLALFLTILTVISSVLRPSERYTFATLMLIQLHDWEMGLVLDLRAFEDKAVSPAQIENLLRKKDRELSIIAEGIVTKLLQWEPRVPSHTYTKGG